MEDVKTLIEKLESMCSSPTLENEFRKNEEEKRKMEEYVKTDEYWSWLSNYLEKNNYIHNCPSFEPIGFTCDDYKYAKMLNNLFCVISDYAEKNYFYPAECATSISYEVKNNDKFYRVSLNYGQGSFCSVQQINESNRYLDFDYILLLLALLSQKANQKFGVFHLLLLLFQ